MKFSLRLGVIVLPLIVAVVCAWWMYQTRQYQASALKMYRQGLLAGSDASPGWMLEAFGKKRCQELMTQYASTSKDVVFDGNDRWVQILRYPRAYGHDEGDGYTLYSLEYGSPTINWTLGKRIVISDVRFDGDYLVFRVFGKFDGFDYEFEIPENSPAEYRFLWPPGTSVPTINVSELIARDYCIPANLKPSTP